MFYRQKLLVALIEISGGSLPNTDLQKLLFLFCQETGQNYYDFFPYKYGPFSFTSYDDKQKLTNKGVLKKGDSFVLAAPSSYLTQLKKSDVAALQQLMIRHKLRGSALVHQVYLAYPQYAARSHIVDKLLTEQEKDYISSAWDKETISTLFTIGYEGSSIDDYLHRLLFNNVQTLIDVRRNPISRKHGFSQRQLQQYTGKVGIRYVHLPELGIASHLRKNLVDQDDYTVLFEQYNQDILPQQTVALAKITHLLQSDKRIALTCFEADPCMCHRHKIAQQLEAGIDCPIVHI
ncbi:MAG: DUF488 domain-containing protein [Chloroflexi bacterium]|nr:DUF488 domain-containing protein [Chloroflexota bacterium]